METRICRGRFNFEGIALMLLPSRRPPRERARPVVVVARPRMEHHEAAEGTRAPGPPWETHPHRTETGGSPISEATLLTRSLLQHPRAPQLVLRVGAQRYASHTKTGRAV